MTTLPRANFAHLLNLRGPYGVFEHAKMSQPRVEHGYCTDDVSRVAVVLARQGEALGGHEVEEMLWSSLHFMELAQDASGMFRNRRHASGDWEFAASNGDWWGRAQWALGTMYARCDEPGLVERAGRAFQRGARVRSPWPRSMAFAMLGASEFLTRSPDDPAARQLLGAGMAVLDRENISSSWRWPERRLTYANALLPEALMAGSSYFGIDHLVERSLDQLRWLLDVETPRGFLSVTPTSGRDDVHGVERFDQQPIEVATMADACVRAHALTGDDLWREGREACEGWFTGANDGHAVMFDPHSGGGFDGLTSRGPNLNQGAESTLALLATQQHVRRDVASMS